MDAEQVSVFLCVCIVRNSIIQKEYGRERTTKKEKNESSLDKSNVFSYDFFFFKKQLFFCFFFFHLWLYVFFSFFDLQLGTLSLERTSCAHSFPLYFSPKLLQIRGSVSKGNTYIYIYIYSPSLCFYYY